MCVGTHMVVRGYKRGHDWWMTSTSVEWLGISNQFLTTTTVRDATDVRLRVCVCLHIILVVLVVVVVVVVVVA